MAEMDPKVAGVVAEVTDFMTAAGLYRTSSQRTHAFNRWSYWDCTTGIMLHVYLVKGGLVEIRASHTGPGIKGSLLVYYCRADAAGRKYWLKAFTEWVQAQQPKAS